MCDVMKEEHFWREIILSFLVVYCFSEACHEKQERELRYENVPRKTKCVFKNRDGIFYCSGLCHHYKIKIKYDIIVDRFELR